MSFRVEVQLSVFDESVLYDGPLKLSFLPDCSVQSSDRVPFTLHNS